MNVLKNLLRKNDNADFINEEEDEKYELYGIEDIMNEDEAEQAEEAALVSALNSPARKEPEIHPAAPDRVEVKMIQPKSRAEARIVADHLKSGSIVMLDISYVPKAVLADMIAFISGVVYVLGGELMKANKFTLVASPSGVDVSGIVVPEAAPAPVEEEEVEYEETEEVEETEN